MSLSEWLLFFAIIDGPILAILYYIWKGIGHGFYWSKDKEIE